MEQLGHNADLVLLHCAGRTRSIIGAHTIKAAGYRGDFGIFEGYTGKGLMALPANMVPIEQLGKTLNRRSLSPIF